MLYIIQFNLVCSNIHKAQIQTLCAHLNTIFPNQISSILVSEHSPFQPCRCICSIRYIIYFLYLYVLYIEYAINYRVKFLRMYVNRTCIFITKVIKLTGRKTCLYEKWNFSTSRLFDTKKKKNDVYVIYFFFIYLPLNLIAHT